jgi:putative DNA primase/helicase
LPLEDPRLSRHSEADDPSIDKAGRTQGALKIWRATENADGTVVERYLRSSRGIEASIPEVLRFHPALEHRPSGTVYPGMVALVTDGVTGEAIGVHRTYLSLDGGGKAPVEPNKMMLGPTRSGAVRLLTGSGPLLVGEGIETCLSVMQATGHATWAALSTSGIRSLDFPEAIHDVILIPDSDDQGQGMAAAQHAARRWCRQGRLVRIAPAPPGSDFNDLLTKKRERPTW